MVEFIFTMVLMVCLSAVLYLMVRALPRIAEEPSEGQGMLDRWARSDIPEKVDAAFNAFVVKFLRRIKVVVLKLDNTLSKHVQKIKVEERENEKKAAIDFKEITNQGTPAEERRREDRRRQRENNSEKPLE